MSECVAFSAQPPTAATPHQDWDVIVVGAGPAGTLTAMQAAQDGLRTLLVDKHSFPRDKVCGGCVNGRAVQILAAAGLAALLDELDAPEVTHLELHRRGRTTRLDAMQGRAVSRRALDLAMVQAAQRHGVVFRPRTQAIVGGLVPNGSCRQVAFESEGEPSSATARVVVAADGLGHPSLRRLSGFELKLARHSHLGIGATWAANEAADVVSEGAIAMAVGREGYVGVVRVEHGKLNAAAAVNANAVKRLGLTNVVREILKEAGTDHELFRQVPWVGTRPLTCESRTVAAERLFLVGDATGYVEPFTGEGIAWALGSAWQLRPLLRQACDAWRDEYARQWTVSRSNMRQREQQICRAVRWTLRVPILVGSAMAVLSRFPMLATPIVRHLNRPWVPEEVTA